MIINIRGTHGSGKSELVHKLLARYSYEVITREDGKIMGYAVYLQEVKKPVMIVGPYHTQCGGCDAVQPYALIWPRVEGYAKKCHVVFEGALVSTSVGVVGEGLVKLRKQSVVAYLSTPVELCLQRIQERRSKKGITRPLDPKNTVNKAATIARTRAKFEAQGVRCVTLNYKKAFKQLMELLHENS